MVQSFFTSGRLLKEWNHTFLCLMPKTISASSLSDYRPISCYDVLYKIISKVLCNRLQAVISDLILPNQTTFLKGRLISDNTLLTHELVRDFNKSMGKRMCLKVDLRKAFDTINREFIYHLMHLMGYPRKWIVWIKECISLPFFRYS